MRKENFALQKSRNMIKGPNFQNKASLELRIKKSGPKEFYPDYYRNKPDMEGEAYEAQTKGIYKSIKNAYEMGLISQIPVSEEVANNLPIEDMKNPNRLIEKRFSVDPHNKQHLFGKGLQKEPEPINKQFFDESPFGIQNEVYPTKYVHTKSEPTRLGGGSFQKPPKSTLKTYAGTERKGYMEDRLGATMQAENIAKINFDKSQNFNDFNEKLK